MRSEDICSKLVSKYTRLWRELDGRVRSIVRELRRIRKEEEQEIVGTTENRRRSEVYEGRRRRRRRRLLDRISVRGEDNAVTRPEIMAELLARDDDPVRVAEHVGAAIFDFLRQKIRLVVSTRRLAFPEEDDGGRRLRDDERRLQDLEEEAHVLARAGRMYQKQRGCDHCPMASDDGSGIRADLKEALHRVRGEAADLAAAVRGRRSHLDSARASVWRLKGGLRGRRGNIVVEVSALREREGQIVERTTVLETRRRNLGNEGEGLRTVVGSFESRRKVVAKELRRDCFSDRKRLVDTAVWQRGVSQRMMAGQLEANLIEEQLRLETEIYERSSFVTKIEEGRSEISERVDGLLANASWY